MKPVQNRFPADPIMQPPLYFVPTKMLCSCGQDLFFMETTKRPAEEPYQVRLFVIVECTNPLCPENLKEKRILLPVFRDYEYMENVV